MKTFFLCICFTLTIPIALSAQLQQISSEKAKDDIEKLVQLIESVHYNPYFLHSKTEIISKKDSLFQTWNTDSIPARDFIKSGMQLTALMSRGHTSFSWQSPLILPAIYETSYIPFKVRLKNKNLIVSSSLIRDIEIGDTITTINGQKAEDLFSQACSFTGGVKSFKIKVTESLFPLYLFFLLDKSQTFVIETNTKEKISTKGINIGELINMLNESSLKSNYDFEVIENNIGLLSYNSCQGYEAFESFLDSTFAYIKEQNIDKLIVDIRYNSGGNSDLNNLLLPYLTTKKYRQFSGRYWKVSEEVKTQIREDSLWYNFVGVDFINNYLSLPSGSIIDNVDTSYYTYPEKPIHFFEGKHCFLISPYTFSSANFLADAVKTFNISTLIGEPTGELTNDFGEQVTLQLPHSKSDIFIPTTYDIGAAGDQQITSVVSPDILCEENQLERAIQFLKEGK